MHAWWVTTHVREAVWSINQRALVQLQCRRPIATWEAILAGVGRSAVATLFDVVSRNSGDDGDFESPYFIGRPQYAS